MFINKQTDVTLTRYIIKHLRLILSNPQSNGQTEATNKVFKDLKHDGASIQGLLEYTSQICTLACKTSLKESNGFSIYPLIYGIETVTLIELSLSIARVIVANIEVEVFSKTHSTQIEAFEERMRQA